MTNYTAVVSQSATDDPEMEWFFYSAGYVLASGSIGDCVAEAMSFANNCNPHESAEVKREDGIVVWRYGGPKLRPAQFMALTRPQIEAAIAAATEKGWSPVGERVY